MAGELNSTQFDVAHAKLVVKEVFEAANKQKWDDFTELMCSTEQEYYEYYFSTDELTKGIKQIQSVSLLNTYWVEKELAKDEWLILL